MRNAFIITALAVALASPAVAEDRFSPDNAWFSQFEETCRDGLTMNEECQAGVMGAYVEAAGDADVRCDFAAFWVARDRLGDTLGVLPWQYGVEAIIAEPGVCGPV